VTGGSFVALDLQNLDGTYHLRLATAEENIAILKLGEPAVTLKLKVGEGGACSLGVALNESDFYQLGPSFQASPGRWIGAKVGIYCITTDVLDPSGFADFAWFRFGPLHCPLEQRSGRVKRGEPHEESISRASGVSNNANPTDCSCRCAS
jgi:hypothetical protein